MTLQVANPNYFVDRPMLVREPQNYANPSQQARRASELVNASKAIAHSHRSTLNSATVGDVDDLLRSAQQGDDAAFASLIRHYRRFAEIAAQRILRTEEAAADAVQEAMYKVYRALPNFQDGNFRSWLLRIVKNTCYDHLRQQNRRQAVSLDELLEFGEPDTTVSLRPSCDGEDPEAMIVQKEMMDTLLAAINELPYAHRAVVMLVDIHGLDYVEAANYLNVPMGTIKSRLSRARAALRDHLTEVGLVPGQPA